jgi:hypothetical protein
MQKNRSQKPVSNPNLMFYRALLFLTIISQFACGQTPAKNKTKPFSFLDSLLKKDTVTLEILDFSFPADVQEIMLRFQKAMTLNKEWAKEYFSKNLKEGEPLPYNEKFGISAEEYQKIKDIEKSPPSVVIKTTATLKVNRTSSNITFTTTNQGVKFLELLKIDLNNQALLFDNDTIPFHAEFTAPASSPFGEWHGYAWKKEISNLGEGDDLNIDKLVAKIIEIDFGKVEPNGKGILRFKYKDVDKGQVKTNVDMPYYIK